MRSASPLACSLSLSLPFAAAPRTLRQCPVLHARVRAIHPFIRPCLVCRAPASVVRPSCARPSSRGQPSIAGPLRACVCVRVCARATSSRSLGRSVARSRALVPPRRRPSFVVILVVVVVVVTTVHRSVAGRRDLLALILALRCSCVHWPSIHPSIHPLLAPIHPSIACTPSDVRMWAIEEPGSGGGRGARIWARDEVRVWASRADVVDRDWKSIQEES